MGSGGKGSTLGSGWGGGVSGAKFGGRQSIKAETVKEAHAGAVAVLHLKEGKRTKRNGLTGL